MFPFTNVNINPMFSTMPYYYVEKIHDDRLRRSVHFQYDEQELKNNNVDL